MEIWRPHSKQAYINIRERCRNPHSLSMDILMCTMTYMLATPPIPVRITVGRARPINRSHRNSNNDDFPNFRVSRRLSRICLFFSICFPLIYVPFRLPISMTTMYSLVTAILQWIRLTSVEGSTISQFGLRPTDRTWLTGKSIRRPFRNTCMGVLLSRAYSFFWRACRIPRENILIRRNHSNIPKRIPFASMRPSKKEKMGKFRLCAAWQSMQIANVFKKRLSDKNCNLNGWSFIL